MNTLSRRTTGVVLGSADNYAALRARWSALVNRTTPEAAPLSAYSAAHHLLYLALLGKDWRKAFGRIRNRNKLANGGVYNWGMIAALADLHSTSEEGELLAPFNTPGQPPLVTREMLQMVRKMVPFQAAGQYPELLSPEKPLPFSAYDPDGVAYVTQLGTASAVVPKEVAMRAGLYPAATA